MIAIDRYAYQSSLRFLHPGEKVAFSLLTMASVLLLDSPPVSLVVVAAVSSYLVLYGRVPARFYLKLLSPPLVFLLVGVVTVAVSWSGSADSYALFWRFFGINFGLTVEGLTLAGKLFLKSLASISCLYFLILTTPMVEVIALLYRWRFPPILVEMMSLLYRFLFLLLEVAASIMTSQHSRLGYAGMTNSFRSMAKLVTGVFVKAYHQSLACYDAMEARCYQGEFKILDWEFRVSLRVALYIVLFQVLLVMLKYSLEVV